MPETLAECAPLSFGSYRANLQNKTSSRQYTFRKNIDFCKQSNYRAPAKFSLLN